MRLQIVRHADPWRRGKEERLSKAGALEAAALAERFSIQGADAIYCSPLPRAEQTARVTAQRLGMTYGIEAWTRERSEWRIHDPILGPCTAWNIDPRMARLSTESAKGDRWHDHPQFQDTPMNAGWQEIVAGSDALLARHGLVREGHRYRVRQDSQHQIVVFCHMGSALTWLAHLLGFPPPGIWAAFFLATSSVTTILFEQRSAPFAVPRCLAMSDTSHLYAQRLPIQPRGLKANTR